ncbi:MAG: PEP-CTERM sorting domain-containing protein [Verrucomicrobiaceae bacterium]
MKSITLLSVALLATSHAALVSVYSVDLLGDSQPDTLAPTHVAGIVPADTWHPAPGLVGTLSGLTNTGIGTPITTDWNAPTSGTIAGSTSTIGDEDMMEGYLAAETGPGGVVDVAAIIVTSINLVSLGWDYYDVYVYGDQGISATTPTSAMNMIPSGGGVTSYLHQELGVGYGAGTTTYQDSQVGSMEGNYVLFPGLTDPSFIVDISATANGTKAPVNGFQIVGHRNVPEPSTSLLALIAGSLLGLRRRRTS